MAWSDHEIRALYRSDKKQHTAEREPVKYRHGTVRSLLDTELDCDGNVYELPFEDAVRPTATKRRVNRDALGYVIGRMGRIA